MNAKLLQFLGNRLEGPAANAVSSLDLEEIESEATIFELVVELMTCSRQGDREPLHNDIRLETFLCRGGPVFPPANSQTNAPRLGPIPLALAVQWK